VKDKMKKRPNVIIFQMDCVKMDHLSCYGYPVKTTPNIDEAAKDATIFNNMIATSGWTLPTHASLFTGTYPSVHGASKEHLYLDGKFPTLAEILRSNGYCTAGFSSVGYVSRETGLDRGFDAFEESFTKEGMKARLDKYHLRYKLLRLLSYVSETASRDIIPGKITNWKALDWLKSRGEATKPFFMFIHYIDAHKPYIYKKYYNRLFFRDTDKLNKSIEMSLYGWPEYTLKNRELDKDVITTLYDSKIFSIDYCIKEILDHLKKTGEYENTLLIFTADHGEIVTTIFDHHFYITDEVLKIPLIIRYPELFEPGARRDELASTVDILPTIIDALGVDRGGGLGHLHGVSLMRRHEHERYVVAERGKMNDPWLEKMPELKTVENHPPFDCTQKAVRTSRYKYVWSSDGYGEALYDIINDKDETRNIINERADIAGELRQKLFEMVGSGEDKKDIERSSEIEEKLKKSLESLGYM
jgi:arylsulfatase A-like enzyme